MITSRAVSAPPLARTDTGPCRLRASEGHQPQEETRAEPPGRQPCLLPGAKSLGDTHQGAGERVPSDPRRRS
jgi:hypothetical protein